MHMQIAHIKNYVPGHIKREILDITITTREASSLFTSCKNATITSECACVVHETNAGGKDSKASDFILHDENYKAVFWVFVQLWCGKVPNPFFANGSKRQPCWKSFVLWAHVKKLPELLLQSQTDPEARPPAPAHPFPAALRGICPGRSLSKFSLKKRVFVLLCYLPKQPSDALGLLWPSGGIFHKAWLPLGELEFVSQKQNEAQIPLVYPYCFARAEEEPGSCRELFSSRAGEMCQKNGLLVAERKRTIFFKPLLFQTLFKDISRTLGSSYYYLFFSSRFSDELVICSRSYS